MRAAPGSTSFILHHISRQRCKQLIQQFATLTPDGWVIPLWCQRLVETAYTSQELQQLRQQAERRTL